MVSAETNYKTAKAEYDFQSNSALNKELHESKAEVEPSQVNLRHIEDEMRSLDVNADSSRDDHTKDRSLVALRAPLSGVITERKFNAGAGIEAATAREQIPTDIGAHGQKRRRNYSDYAD